MIKGQHLNINALAPETILINDPSPDATPQEGGLGSGDNSLNMQPLQGFGEYDKGLDESAYSG
jgi:serine/threonine protein kinase